jgi:hypothetical protein
MLGPLKKKKTNRKNNVLHADLSSLICGSSRVVFADPTVPSVPADPPESYLQNHPSRTCESSRVVPADPPESYLRLLSQVVPADPLESYLRILSSRTCGSSRIVPADPPESYLRILSNRTCGSSRIVPADPL